MRIVWLGLMLGSGCSIEEAEDPKVEAPELTVERSDSITELAQQAVAVTPAWLRDDLTIAFLRVSTNKQDRLAGQILELEDPNLIDEVAFSIAHLSPEVLEDPDFKNTLVVDNAEWVYRVAPELPYVEIVEIGEAGVDDDWWTVARYTSIHDGETFEVEIDRDTWYWYVVHPRIEDETPFYIDGWAECNSSMLECPATIAEGMIWREFLWEGALEGCPEERYCPVLKDIAPQLEHLWNGLGGGEADGTIREIINFMKSSDEAYGRWLNFGAYDERSVQPNRIYGLGRGNCGEWADMTTAISRTLLLPNVNVTPSSWDHTWSAFWYDGQWIAWEPVNGWVDHPYGISYSVFAARGDASVFLQTPDYNESTFEMHVEVLDKKGVPVDGATVAIFSPWESDGVTYWWMAGERGTDGSGIAVFELVAEHEYGFSVEADLGVYPPEENTLTMGSAGILAGEIDVITVELDGRKMPRGAEISVVDSDGDVALTVDLLDQESRVMGPSYRYGGDSYTLVDTAPVLDMFVVDTANYERFQQGEAFETVLVDPGQVQIAAGEVWHVVVANAWVHSTAAIGTLTVEASAEVEPASREEVRFQLLPGEHVAVQVGG